MARDPPGFEPTSSFVGLSESYLTAIFFCMCGLFSILIAVSGATNNGADGPTLRGQTQPCV
jgi:hypothetical protein